MGDEYIVNQLCINLKDELKDYLVENKNIAAENLLREVNNYLKAKDIHHE